MPAYPQTPPRRKNGENPLPRNGEDPVAILLRLKAMPGGAKALGESLADAGFQGRKLCRFCKTRPVARGRQSYCSAACVEAQRIQTSAPYARVAVQRRDKGVCALCGLDTGAIKQRLDVLANQAVYGATASDRAAARDARALEWAGLTARGFNRNSALWEAHHVKPRVEGGDGCGLDGYATVCVPCHKAQTAELAARLADRASRDPYGWRVGQDVEVYFVHGDGEHVYPPVKVLRLTKTWVIVPSRHAGEMQFRRVDGKGVFHRGFWLRPAEKGQAELALTTVARSRAERAVKAVAE